MKITAVIPARYASTRLPGKPLADICGKPMIWWVYQQAIKVKELSEVIVATDDEKIAEVCKTYDMQYLITSKDHPTGTDRLSEVANKILADLYVCIMGDEPLILAEDIRAMIEVSDEEADAAVLCAPFKSGVDLINVTTQKFALNDKNEVIYMSRAPIPYPQARVDYDIYKNIGVYTYKKHALDFFANTPIGRIESIEASEMLRLIENRKLVKAHITNNFSMSVDTQKDLERVRDIIANRLHQ